VEVGILIPDPSDLATAETVFSANLCLMLLQSGIEIIMVMQLFNWFNKKQLGTIISFWLLCNSLGYAMQFVIGGFW